MKSQTKTVLLVDADVLVYRAGLAVEVPICWGEDLWTLHADLGEAKGLFTSWIDEIAARLSANEVRYALSCPTEQGFRRKLYPLYKANRAGSRRPVVHSALRDWLKADLGAVVFPALEADDVLSIWATEPVEPNERRIVLSIDKDFQGVPCYYSSLDSEYVVSFTEDQAERFHAIQTLTGDATDGFKGIPGYGPVKAAKALEGIETKNLWSSVLAAYNKAGLGEEEALKNARLARLLRHGEYDFNTNSVKLWTPYTNK